MEQAVKYAGFWTRTLATILDFIIFVVVVGSIEGLLTGFSATGFNKPEPLWTLVNSIAWWLYYAFLESSPMQATLGKKICGIIVTDTHGKRISFWRATGRELGKYISTAILGIGFIMCAFTAKKQGLHDKLADSLVVFRPSE